MVQCPTPSSVVRSQAWVALSHAVVQSDSTQSPLASSVLDLASGKLTLSTVEFKAIVLESRPLVEWNLQAQLDMSGMEFDGITQNTGNGAVFEIPLSLSLFTVLLSVAQAYSNCKALGGNGGVLFAFV